MSWACSLSRQAAKQLRSLPRDRLGQVARTIDEIGEDPTFGDVRPIKSGRFKGALRKRVGVYRIVYSIDLATHKVEIAAILVRGEATYRQTARLRATKPMAGREIRYVSLNIFLTCVT